MLDLDFVKVGDIRLTNNPCFIGQIYVVTEVQDITKRFGQDNRLIKYSRWHYMSTEDVWHCVDHKCIEWLYSVKTSDFGKCIPSEYHNELFQTKRT